MGLFLKKKHREPDEITTRHRDPLLAIPIAASDVEARIDNQQCIQLRRTMPVRKGMIGFVVKRFKIQREKRINLDEHGTRFWNQIDGKKNLLTITESLVTGLKADRADCKMAVIMYTKALMQRGFINLKIAKG